jgi:uncharacterized protein YbjT (DUF2867 family)
LQRHAIAAPRQAGVSHAVKLFAFGASPHSKSTIARMHHQIEKELAKIGVAVDDAPTHHFMPNFLS